MWLLLGTAITTSFFDSLNPSAIAQQMLLQAMVKNKRHIWFFILGIGLANFVMGAAIYYGVATWVSDLLSKAVASYPWHVYGCASGAGLICFIAGIRLTVKTRVNRRAGNNGEAGTANAPAQLSPLSLFLMGAAFCIVELTSALPYFGFIAMLASYRLVFPLVLIFLLIYTFMYVLPLILLYFGYSKLRGTRGIKKLECALGRVSAYIVPVAIGVLGLLLLFYGVSAMIHG